MRAINTNEKKRLNNFLSRKNLKLKKQLAQGHSSFVFLTEKNNQKFALKLERSDSGRKNMIEKEASNLKKANSLGIGPKLYSFDKKNNAILMEFINGNAFTDWLSQNPSKNALISFLKELFFQAILLDKAGLDHGQLAGRGANILVKNNLPVIIDFEKASQKRKPHNFSRLFSYLFLGSSQKITQKIKSILEWKKMPG